MLERGTGNRGVSEQGQGSGQTRALDSRHIRLTGQLCREPAFPDLALDPAETSRGRVSAGSMGEDSEPSWPGEPLLQRQRVVLKGGRRDRSRNTKLP